MKIINTITQLLTLEIISRNIDKFVKSTLAMPIHAWSHTTNIMWPNFKKKQTLWPLFMDGVQLPQGYSHFEEAVYFLPLSSAIFQKSEFLCKSYERQVSDSQWDINNEFDL